MTPEARCWKCDRAAIGEVYSKELRVWRWWCRGCLIGNRRVA